MSSVILYWNRFFALPTVCIYIQHCHSFLAPPLQKVLLFAKYSHARKGLKYSDRWYLHNLLVWSRKRSIKLCYRHTCCTEFHHYQEIHYSYFWEFQVTRAVSHDFRSLWCLYIRFSEPYIEQLQIFFEVVLPGVVMLVIWTKWQIHTNILPPLVHTFLALWNVAHNYGHSHIWFCKECYCERFGSRFLSINLHYIQLNTFLDKKVPTNFPKH